MKNISIHALREEGDHPVGTLERIHGHFNPRPPRGGRPYDDKNIPGVNHISIHALREEGDGKLRYFVAGEYGDFNPRPPRGGRHANQ